MRKHPSLRKRVIACLLATGLLAPHSYSAAASDDLGSLSDLLPPSPSGPNAKRSFDGRVQIFQDVLVHPMPVWSPVSSGPAPAEQSRMRIDRTATTYQMSMIPREESFETWKNLFSIVGHNRPVRSLERHANVVSGQFVSICSPRNTQVFKVDQNPRRLMQVIACGNYSRDRNSGQIAIVVAMQSKTGLVTMTRQWRTKAFQARIQTNWPIPKLEVDGVLVELSRARLIPS